MEQSAAPVAEESQEDRIAWLRERGIEIDIPGERKQDKLAEATARSIRIVKIPCKSSEAYSQLDIPVNDNANSDQLITALKPFFVSSESIKEEALHRAAEGLMQSSDTPANMGVGRDRLSDMLSGEGHVEAFPLTRPAASNEWTGVNAYLDEAGQLKGLPLNQRASALAGFCGFENIQLLGDIYIGRVIRSGGASKPRHVDITLEEIESSSPWITTAFTGNYQQGVASGRVEMPSGGSDLLSKEMHSSDPGKPYSWTQSEDTVDVSLNMVSFSEEKVSKKELIVSIKSTHLNISHKTLGPMLDLSLSAAIKPSDSTWSISGDVIEVSMEKSVEAVWQQLEK